MKPEATLEDYQRRELFLIKYVEHQIWKIDSIKQTEYPWEMEHAKGKRSAYKDILYKLTKNDSTADSK